MLHFTLKTKTEDFGLSYETTESFTVETVGTITVVSNESGTRCNMQGREAQNNLGAMLECLEFINNSLRNSKNLKVESFETVEGGTIKKGKVNFSRSVWGAL